MNEHRGWLSILLNALFSLANHKTVQGSGNVIEESREVSGFTDIAMAGMGKLTIEVGEEESLRIEAEDNLIEYLETEVSNGKLRIGVQRNIRLRPKQPIRFYVTARELNAIALSGSGSIEAPDLKAEGFSVTISGSGDASIGNLKAETLAIKISGSGTMGIDDGLVEKQDVTISGSGGYQAENLRSEAGKVRISGSGSARVWADKSLNARISGSGSVDYRGDPEINFSSSGSGRIKSLGNP